MEQTAVCVTGIRGRMGTAIAQAIADQDKLTLSTATVSEPQNVEQTIEELIGLKGMVFQQHPKMAENLAQSDFAVMIDFTSPKATLQHLAICKSLNKPLVIGTTGFSEQERQQIADAAKYIPIVFAPNTSRGIQLCVEALEKLTQAIGHEADIEIIEAHHKHKKDAPSGTALKLGETVAEKLGQPLEEIASFSREGVQPQGRDKKIGFSVIRAGDIVGEHTVLFSLPGERIEIKHIASSRQTFAQGALQAAQWVKDKAPGLYSMRDVLA